MRILPRPAAATAVGIALALVLVGCGGDDESAKETTTTTEAEESTTTTKAEESTTTSEADDASTTTTVDGLPEDALLAVIEPLLLTAEDIGPGLSASARPDGETPPPCGIDPDDDHPPAVKTGVLIGSDVLELYMVEDIRAYSTADEASAAFAQAQEGFGCGTATDSSDISLGDLTDVSDTVGTEAFALDASVEGDPISIIVALYSDAIISFQFQGDAAVAQSAGIPSSLAIATGGTQKLIDGLS